jgi:hypothetical protein
MTSWDRVSCITCTWQSLSTLHDRREITVYGGDLIIYNTFVTYLTGFFNANMNLKWH